MAARAFVLLGALAVLCSAAPRKRGGVLIEPLNPTWYTWGSAKYYFSQSMVSWAQADSYCKRLSSNLASIHTKEENLFIRNTRAAQTASGKKGFKNHFWIGGEKNLSGNSNSPYSWYWSDNSDFDILPLYDGCLLGQTCFWNVVKGKTNSKLGVEPNNFYGNENCLALESFQKESNPGTWRDEPCSADYNFVCKLACPANSISINGNINNGCRCAAGFSGSITSLAQAPFLSGSCQPVACPTGSTGSSVASGCQCSAGFTGSVMATSESPFYTPGCTPIACPANSMGDNVPSGCTCNAGFSGTISAAPNGYSGACVPQACPSNSFGDNVPKGCTCNAGFRGAITASQMGPNYYTGGCEAEGCPANTNGDNLPAGCATNPGYMGSVMAIVGNPYYSGSVLPVDCPMYSSGSHVPAGCTCNAGYSGTISATTTAPYFSGFCEAVVCPPNTFGMIDNSLPTGCDANAGYRGSVSAIVGSPYFTGNVVPVECPANSFGTNIPEGCTCNAGFRGVIMPSQNGPDYFTGGCQAESCPAHTSGIDLPTGCTAKPGYMGSVAAIVGSPYYSGSVNAVACPENSFGDNVPAGCTCNAGFKGTIMATFGPDFFTGQCENVPCPENTNGPNVATGCATNAGFSGGIEPMVGAPYYSGAASAVQCPPHSFGTDVPRGCTCNAGYSGTITATTIAPDSFAGSCVPEPCPANTMGNSIPAGCATNAGFSGTISAFIGFPFYTGQVIPVACPPNSFGDNVPMGCTCNAGYRGTIAASLDGPDYFTGMCTPVACPEGSSGFDVPTGCFCNAGYAGNVTAVVGDPYFYPGCFAQPCPEVVTTGDTVPQGCSCAPGYSGTFYATTVGPDFFVKTCTPVPCPAHSRGNFVPDQLGCQCSDYGYIGDLTPTTTAPYYAQDCFIPDSCAQWYGFSKQFTKRRLPIDIVGNGSSTAFAVTCFGPLTLVAVRASGVPIFQEPIKQNLDFGSSLNLGGRQNGIWSASNDNFKFSSMFFTTPDFDMQRWFNIGMAGNTGHYAFAAFGGLNVGSIPAQSSSSVFNGDNPFSGIPFGVNNYYGFGNQPTTLSGLLNSQNGYSTSPLAGATVYSNNALANFFVKAATGDNTNAALFAFNGQSLASQSNWDTTGAPYWVASGTTLPADAATSSDNVAGLALGTTSCDWAARCNGVAYPTYTPSGTTAPVSTNVWLW